MSSDTAATRADRHDAQAMESRRHARTGIKIKVNVIEFCAVEVPTQEGFERGDRATLRRDDGQLHRRLST